MAITHRKGDYNDYDPSRMRPAEFGITLMHDPKAVDGRAVHIAFAAGEDKTLMTFEDAEGMIEDATADAISGATTRAETAATTATKQAKLAQSYAKGGTSSRTGEDTDNALYYKNQASSSASSASGSATTADTHAKTSEAWAKGTKGGTAVSSGDDQYNNHSKYWANQSASSASSASGSATTATNQRKEAEAWAVGKKDGTDVQSTDSQYHNNSKYYSEQASSSATSASGSATASSNSAKESKSYAVGGTSSRTGEDTDNAKYYLEQAEAVAESIPEDYSELSDDVGQLKNALMLQEETIPDTVQTITFDSAGNVSAITHTANNVAVRTDAFTFGTDTITEVRTLSTGESLTIVTNTTTLQTTVTYAAA